MTCSHCGARLRQGDGRFCSHCGSQLADAPRITADEWRTHPERFAEARQLPGFAAAMEHTPVAPAHLLELVAPVAMAIFGVFFFSLFIDGAPGEMASFGVLFGIAWFGVLLWAFVRALRYRAAPVRAALAVIVDERIEVSGGGENSRASTCYYVTLQLETGTRLEYDCPDHLAGILTRGDLGVAYTKHTRLIELARLDV